HPAGRADQALAHRGDEAADLRLGLDPGQRPAVLLRERQPALALDEARPPAPLDPERVALRRVLVGHREAALVGALDRGHADRQRRRELVRADRLQPFAAGRGAGEDGGVVEQRPHAIARRLEVVAAVEGHGCEWPSAVAGPPYRTAREAVKAGAAGIAGAGRPPSPAGDPDRTEEAEHLHDEAADPQEPPRHRAEPGGGRPARARDLDPVAAPRPPDRDQQQDPSAQEAHGETQVHHIEDRHGHAGIPDHRPCPPATPRLRRAALIRSTTPRPRPGPAPAPVRPVRPRAAPPRRPPAAPRPGPSPRPPGGRRGPRPTRRRARPARAGPRAGPPPALPARAAPAPRPAGAPPRTPASPSPDARS